jgi:hypothetical protein
LIQDDPDKPSPWNVIIYQFTLDHAMVNLAAFIPDTPPAIGSVVVRGTIDGLLSLPRLHFATAGTQSG